MQTTYRDGLPLRKKTCFRLEPDGNQIFFILRAALSKIHHLFAGEQSTKKAQIQAITTAKQPGRPPSASIPAPKHHDFYQKNYIYPL